MAALSQYRVIPASEGEAAKEVASARDGGVRLEALANLAHELRTPIQVVLGYLEILRDDFADQLSGEPGKIIERMNSNVHDLAQTVENVMAFAMAHHPSESKVEEVFELDDLFNEVMPLLEAANRNKKLEIVVAMAGSLKSVRCARRPVKAILSNLASNAIKFTGSGRVTISVTEGPAQNGSESIVIEVTDTGPGIEPHLLDHAFKSLLQLSDSNERRFRGLGLGLAVVHRNVRALGATLEVRTAGGKGCSFKVTIPCRVVKQARKARFNRVFKGAVRIVETPPTAVAGRLNSKARSHHK